MHPSLLWLVPGSLFLTFALAGHAQAPSDTEPDPRKAAEAVEKLIRAADDSERREAAWHAIAKTFDDTLPDLEAHDHDGIALYAAWEQVRRTVRLKPEHEAELPEPVKLDRRALQRFLGFAEGRLRVPLPDWWERRLANAYVYPDDAAVLWFKHKEPLKPYSKAGSGIYAPNRFSAKLLPNDDLQLTDTELDDGTCRIPARFLQEARKKYLLSIFGNHLTASIDAKRCVFGFHDEFATGFTVHCMDRKSSEIVWSAEIFAYFGGGSTGAGHTHWVAMRQAEETLYLFGTDGGCVYIEAFSMMNGANQFRFCTDYLWLE